MSIVKMGDVRALNPIYYGGGGGSEPGVDCGCTRTSHFVGGVQSFESFNQTVAMDSTGTIAVVGAPENTTDPSSTNPGRLDVYEYSGGSWSLTTSLDNSSDPDTAGLGYWTGVADDATIMSREGLGDRVHVFTRTGPTTWTHTLIRNVFSPGSQMGACINRDGNIIAVANGTEFYVYKLIAGTWTLQQTISVTPDNVQAVAISADGDFIVTSGADTAGTPNTQMRVHTSGGALLTWTLDTSYTPTTDNGNTRTMPYSQVAISGNKDLIAVVCPNDQDGASVDGSVILYKKNVSTAAYTQIAFLRSEVLGAGFYLGIGSVAISDDGTKMFVGEPYGIAPGFAEEGRVFSIDNPAALTGAPEYLLSTQKRISNPYFAIGDRQQFGMSIACGGDGTRVLVASGNFANVVGRDTADFFDCSATMAFHELFNGSAGTMSGRSPDVGGSYSGLFGSSLSDMPVDGSGSNTSDSGTGSYAGSAFASAIGASYTFTQTFTPTVGGSGNSFPTSMYVDSLLYDSGSGNTIIEPYLAYERDGAGPAHKWNLYPLVKTIAGSTVYSAGPIDVTSYVTSSVEHTLTVEVSGSGTVWKIDGSTVASDSGTTDLPDSVAIVNSSNELPDRSVALSEVSVE